MKLARILLASSLLPLAACGPGEDEKSGRFNGTSSQAPLAGAETAPDGKSSDARAQDQSEDQESGAVSESGEPGDGGESQDDLDRPEAGGDDSVGEAPEPVDETAGEPAEPPSEEDIFRSLPDGADQMKVICSRPGRDKVRQVFCGPTPPTITSLVDLQTALGLSFTNPQATGRNNNGRNGNPGFAITGHSSSLVARFVSAINPRIVMFTPTNGNADPDFVSLGFVRGEQFAEIIANDPDTDVAAFFLVKFEQACGDGCKAGDLLTPAVEKNWTKFTIYEDADIKNTVADCLQCHQPEGPGTPKMLRMQELRNPWTHFFRNNTGGGQALIADFQAAHGTTEDYGGIPAAQITSSEPANLENFIRDNGFGNQPNEFPTGTIEQQVRNSSPGQPANNSTPGVSAAWQTIYNRARAGTVIAVPYHDVKVTDPTKLSAMTAAYKSVQAGTMPQADLPDIREVFVDSRAHEMGFAVQPGSTAQEILMQACAQCHNSKLDQSLTRARFNVDLTKMDRAEKDLAIERLKLTNADPKRMPPARFRSLTAAEIEALTQLLKQ